MHPWDEQIERIVRQFLADHRTASLATTDDAGHPHAANVWYAHDDDDLSLYFLSSPRSAHSQHLARSPAAALTIYHDTDTPTQIHGLQLHGTSTPLPSTTSDHTRALNRYAQKYPFITHPPYRRAAESDTLFRITPTWLRWLDNRQTFGIRTERPHPPQRP